MRQKGEMHAKPLVFGCVAGKPVIIHATTGASEVYAVNSGRWCRYDDNQGRVTLALTLADMLCGWIVQAPFTTSGTDDVSEVDIDVSLNTLYEMPIDTARTAAQLHDYMWESCDIACGGVTSIQYADYDASEDDVLQMIDYRAYSVSSSANNTLIVRRNITGTTASVICAEGAID